MKCERILSCANKITLRNDLIDGRFLGYKKCSTVRTGECANSWWIRFALHISKLGTSAINFYLGHGEWIGCVCVRFYSFTDSPFKWFRMILKTGLLCSLKCSLRIFTIDFDCIFSRLWNLFFLRIFRSLKISNTLRFGTVSMGEQKNGRIRRNGNADFISSYDMA